MDQFDDSLLDIDLPPPPPPDKVYDYYATVVGGLEDVAVNEIKKKLVKVSDVQVIRGRRLSRVFFHYERSPKKLLELRSVVQIHVLLANFKGVTAGQPGLLHIAKKLGQVDLIPGAVLHDILYGPKEEPGFRLSCTLGKGHRFSASELHHIVNTVLTMKYEVDDQVDRPYGLHLRVEGNRALFGLQIASQTDWEKTHYPVQVRGDLQASVAYGLAQLARLRRDDVVLDVACGGGKFFLESGLDGKRSLFLGLDTELAILEGMQENAEFLGVEIKGVVGLGDALPADSGTITKLLGNLMPRKGAEPISLFRFFSEMVRVLCSDGQAFVIHEDRRIFARMLDDFPKLKLIKRRPLHLQGRHPDLYILQRR